MNYYRWIVGGNVFACVLFGVVATFSFPGWLAMFDALMAGACFSAALHTIMLERLARQLRNLGEVCGLLHESNVSLMGVLVVFAGRCTGIASEDSLNECPAGRIRIEIREKGCGSFLRAMQHR